VTNVTSGYEPQYYISSKEVMHHEKASRDFRVGLRIDSQIAFVTAITHQDKAAADYAPSGIVYPEQASDCEATDC